MSSTEAEFFRWKSQSLQKLDQSRKGGVDADIVPLVDVLNRERSFFTTSSCSGRVILINQSSDCSEVQKQNCQWLFVSHQKCSAEELISAVDQAEGDAVLKFEPFVLHVQCWRLEDAQLLHSVAVNSGFRNSGLTVGKTGKIISAVRSTHGLEVPLSQRGRLLVAHDYIHFLSHICNQKMEENLRRIQRFQTNLQKALTAADRPRLHLPECTALPPSANQDSPDQHTVYRRRRRRLQADGCHDDKRDTRDGCHDDSGDTRDGCHDDSGDTRHGCHDDSDRSPTQLNDCLDLFT